MELPDFMRGWDSGLSVAEANAAYERGAFDRAAALYKRILDEQGDDAAVATRLASSLLNASRHREALRAAKKAADLDPGAAAPHVMAAGAALGLGDLDEAERLADEAMSVDESSTTARLCKADMLRYRGEREKARALLEETVARAPGDARAAASLSRVTPAGEAAPVVEDLARMARDEARPPTERRVAAFALGSALEKMERFEEAFEAFTLANRLRDMPFDAAAHERLIAEMIDAWSPERVARLPRGSDADETPVFVLGMPRSGTTLVEQIIAAHPEAFGGGERPWLPETVRALLDGPSLGEALEGLTRERVDEAARSQLSKIRDLAPDASRVTDKLPLNFLHMGPIWLLFPGARVIHCTRDPVDTCLSCWTHDFRGALRFAYDLESLGAYYLQYERLMAHWAHALDVPTLEVPYEGLVEDHEAWSRRIVEFLGLGWDEACLRHHEQASAAITASAEQVRRPVYRSAVGRAARYGDRLAPLRRALGAE